MALSVILCVGICSCKKDNYNIAPQSNVNMEWVDMGLPSGLKWGKSNLELFSMEVDGYRSHYAWGEVNPKKNYFWSTYQYCTVNAHGDLATLTKYNTQERYGKVDDRTYLKPLDDAATVALGHGARTPTREEWQELIDNTTNEWTNLNGVNGWVFVSANKDTLFLPAAGYYEDSVCYSEGICGRYWTSSLVTPYPDDAMVFRFGAKDAGVYGSLRYYGYSVRPVLPK